MVYSTDWKPGDDVCLVLTDSGQRDRSEGLPASMIDDLRYTVARYGFSLGQYGTTPQMLRNLLSMPPRGSEPERGPFRAQPELDVDYWDDAHQPLGTATGLLSVQVDAKGIVIQCTVQLRPGKVTRIGGYSVWVGDCLLRCQLAPPIVITASNDTCCLHINLPFYPMGDIDHRPRNDPDPPQPLDSLQLKNATGK